MLNADMEFYKLAGIADIGEIVVHLDITPETRQARRHRPRRAAGRRRRRGDRQRRGQRHRRARSAGSDDARNVLGRICKNGRNA